VAGIFWRLHFLESCFWKKFQVGILVRRQGGGIISDSL